MREVRKRIDQLGRAQLTQSHITLTSDVANHYGCILSSRNESTQKSGMVKRSIAYPSSVFSPSRSDSKQCFGPRLLQRFLPLPCHSLAFKCFFNFT